MGAQVNGSQKQQLISIARSAMKTNGFEVDIPAAALAQADAARPDATLETGVRDLRGLPWSSIDNDDSRDLDQIEVCITGNGVTRVLVGIADVDTLVPSGSPADDHAHANTTSVYTPAVVFPMLPLQLSTDRTSLNENEDRRALVADMTVGPDGTVTASDIYRAIVRNHAQLTYNAVAAWLDGDGPAPAAFGRVPGLDAQLRLQVQISDHMQSEREALGALDFDRAELRPVVDDGGVKDLQTDKPNRAKLLIENFMIAGNGSAVRFLNLKGFPSVRRVVKSPERWSRIVDLAEQHGGKLPPDPDAPALQQFLKDQRAKAPATFPDLSLAIIKLLGRGEYVAVGANDPSAHFALAVHEYSHVTAPNRRYADVLMQRLLKAAIAGGKPPYTLDQLQQLAQHCTDREDAANKVERLTKKAAAALWLGDRIGQQFDAIVTGVGPKGTWVRLTAMPVEGRLDSGTQGLDVGDRIHVKLISTDPPRGFIDFARIS